MSKARDPTLWMRRASISSQAMENPFGVENIWWSLRGWYWPRSFFQNNVTPRTWKHWGEELTWVVVYSDVIHHGVSPVHICPPVGGAQTIWDRSIAVVGIVN